jgi:hypothetical protein
MRGNTINAARIELLNASAATIHLLLRVWILPCDSKVESSNMACLLFAISVVPAK